FFQAEDGIRAFHVTGVQTCALPICRTRAARAARGWHRRRVRRVRQGRGRRRSPPRPVPAPGVALRKRGVVPAPGDRLPLYHLRRSEERRGGKGGSTGGSAARRTSTQ